MGILKRLFGNPEPDDEVGGLSVCAIDGRVRLTIFNSSNQSSAILHPDNARVFARHLVNAADLADGKVYSTGITAGRLPGVEGGGS